MGADAVALIGRVLISVIFVVSGIGKLMAPVATMGYIASKGLPLPELGFAIAVLAEVGGGLALLAGVKTRWVALGLALFSIAAGLMFHFDLGDQSQQINLMKNLAMAGGLLFVWLHGAGAFSVDGLRSRRAPIR